MLDAAKLRAATGCTAERAERYSQHLSLACSAYEISTPKRMAAFLAHVGHESSSLRNPSEIWGPTVQQKRYERNFNKPWPASAAEARQPAFAVNKLAYGLGNHEFGDGPRYCGHGLIQITGRTNHRRCTERLRAKLVGYLVPDFESEPKTLAWPQWAAWSAADYWDRRSCNVMADNGEFEDITRAINGGLTGLEDRLARWAVAKQVFGIT